jgi:hypothetical protein
VRHRRSDQRSPRWQSLGALLFLALLPATVRAEPSFGAHDVRTVFHVAKSDDRNRVDYGIHLDGECQPIGSEPMYVYWHRFEPGQALYGDLNALDRRAYGIASQSVRTRSPAGTWTELRINALPDLRILVLTQRTAQGCIGRARVLVNSRPAYVDRVFVQLAGPLSVEFITLSGVDAVSSAPVAERRTPGR